MIVRPRAVSIVRLIVPAVLGVAVLALIIPRHDAVRAAAERYFSPYAVAVSPDGRTAYVSGKTADEVAVVDLAKGTVQGKLAGFREPEGLALSADGKTLYVASYAADTVTAVDTAKRKAVGKVVVGKRPTGVTLSPDGKRLYVCNRFSNDVSVVDLTTLKELGRVPVIREPRFAAVTPDGRLLFVSNLLPLGRNDDPKLAADVSIIDTEKLAPVGSVHLPTGCTEVGQIICSPDGKYVYVVSLLARFLVPPTQISRGWINTNALSVIDVEKSELLATVLLDELDRGAANPFGVVLTPDGKTLLISLSGTHQIMRVDTEKLLKVITDTPVEKREELSRDLTLLYRNGVEVKYASGGQGPKGIALVPNTSDLLVANYYSDALTRMKTDEGKVTATIPVGAQGEPDEVRKGEALFHDATICFQSWQSCSSCHPDVRSDGLRWDLLNDGMGNPKNAKSLLLSWCTPPVMAHGVREGMEEAVVAGIRFILFREPEPGEAEAIGAFLKALKPEPSPYLLAGGKLSPAAERGRKLFESPRTGCAVCHPAPLYTDLKTYDVGTRSELDSGAEFDNPTLVELYRTGPYLHDGCAVTLNEVLLDRNPEDKHGKTKGLNEKEIDDLVQFLLSL